MKRKSIQPPTRVSAPVLGRGFPIAPSRINPGTRVLILSALLWGVGLSAPLPQQALPFVTTPAHAGTLEGEVKIWESWLLLGAKEVEDRSNAVVFLAGLKESPPEGRNAELAQHNRKFSTRVLAITQGETVSFPNLDTFHHNVWSKSKAQPFDLGLFKHPETRSVTFPKTGIVTVFCNIHPQMIATIFVLPNRRFAVTARDGRYAIRDVPAGEYTLFAWVEGAEPVRQGVTVAQDGTVRADFRLEMKRIPEDHPDKDGHRYKQFGQEGGGGGGSSY